MSIVYSVTLATKIRIPAAEKKEKIGKEKKFYVIKGTKYERQQKADKQIIQRQN